MGKSVTSFSFVMTHYNETCGGYRTILSYNLADYQKEKVKNTLNMIFRLSMKMIQRTGMIAPFMAFAVSSGIAAVIWYGSHLITTDVLTPGDFVSFLTALVMLYTPIKAIGNNAASVQMAMMAIERVRQVLDYVPSVSNREKPVPIDGVAESVTFERVSFEYRPGVRALDDINVKISVGETIALVGNSGGGKSTFVSLLSRFYDVTKGRICIDGIDIRDIDIASLRRNIAVVFQDNFLFSGTIRQNIVLDHKDATEEDVNQAVESAYLQTFVSSLEEGLDTEIGERGILLSGGQKQRVAIARAFLKNAPIVVLDEATSALDSTSESVVQMAIANLMKNKTVFVIAHRLSTIKDADRIVVVNDGKIAEIGTHDELLKKEDSLYALLYKTQFKEGAEEANAQK